jgi:hypothetical protein
LDKVKGILWRSTNQVFITAFTGFGVASTDTVNRRRDLVAGARDAIFVHITLIANHTRDWHLANKRAVFFDQTFLATIRLAWEGSQGVTAASVGHAIAVIRQTVVILATTCPNRQQARGREICADTLNITDFFWFVANELSFATRTV